MDGKNVRVVDYYCGTITEQDCFIPSQGLIKGDIVVLKYGFYYFLKNNYNGQLKIRKNMLKLYIRKLKIKEMIFLMQLVKNKKVN